MNLSYLLEYISYHHHTIVRSYSLEHKLKGSHCGRYEFRDLFDVQSEEQTSFASDAPTMTSERIRALELTLLSPGKIPAFGVVLPKLTLLHSKVIYATVFSPDRFFLLGPVCFEGDVTLVHTFETEAFGSEFLEAVPVVDYHAFLTDILLLHNLFHDETITEQDIFEHNFPQKEMNYTVQRKYSDIVFTNQEYGKKHNPYDQEMREQNSIRTGDLEQLKKSWAEDYAGELGTLAKDNLRNMKNIAIVVITLASRSAIAGGVLSEVAFSLSDSFCNQVEAATNTETALYIARNAEIQYTTMVHDLLEQRKKSAASKKQHPKVEKCKDYIFAHLHEKILVSDIAEELLVHPNYLSELFKKTEGVSITDFVLQEKVKLAQNLLSYSDYSYIEIATYLGFASQSHLGRVFKQYTGNTLHEYRKAFGLGNN